MAPIAKITLVPDLQHPLKALYVERKTPPRPTALVPVPAPPELTDLLAQIAVPLNTRISCLDYAAVEINGGSGSQL